MPSWSGPCSIPRCISPSQAYLLPAVAGLQANNAGCAFARIPREKGWYAEKVLAIYLY